MRSKFENSLNHTDGFHDGYVKWNELSNQYESSDEDYLDVAEWMNGTFIMYEKYQSKVDELQKRVDAALTILSSKKKMYVDMVIEIEQALKGGEV